MKNGLSLVKIVVVSCLIFNSFEVNAQDKPQTPKSEQPIFPIGQKAPQTNFTGSVWVFSLIEADSVFNIPVANVTFEPGARSHWHTHGGGQALIAIDGTGYYQEKGKPAQIVHKGDVIKCPPGIEHWHAAAPNSSFVYVAISPAQKGKTIWLQRVTDAEYNSVK